jgi:hypothetical protein
MSEADETPRRRLLWIGLAGAALAALLGMAAPHNGAVWKAPSVLRERVAVALSAAGYAGLGVEMDGQHARLRGIVEDEADIASAREAAMTAAGAVCEWAGGVTRDDI